MLGVDGQLGILLLGGSIMSPEGFAPVPGRWPAARTALSSPRFAGFFYFKMFSFLEHLKTKSDLGKVLLSVVVGWEEKVERLRSTDWSLRESPGM